MCNIFSTGTLPYSKIVLLWLLYYFLFSLHHIRRRTYDGIFIVNTHVRTSFISSVRIRILLRNTSITEKNTTVQNTVESFLQNLSDDTYACYVRTFLRIIRFVFLWEMGYNILWDAPKKGHNQFLYTSLYFLKNI